MNSAMPGPPPDPTDKDSIARARRAEYDAFMDKRLTGLETRFDAILPTLATKVDLAEVRSELRTDMAVGFERIRTDMATLSDKLHQDMNKLSQRIILWMVGIVLTMGLAFYGGTIALTATMFDELRKTAAASQAREPAAAPVSSAVSSAPQPPAQK